ncbi:tRNA (adenosine(37)-N6)-dimethylallyltransferase MiaA [Patescibacteria group bacterium AH-259-L05]|nr:tRNA (adenosine(37)-N6)-dimethylallyltransferase MiaA [Patescibacteria group bacterium AH-259-L05]
MQKQLPKLIIILGPTASGKTELGIRLAKKFDGEIISADSRTIYKEMDIGTAKPRPNPALFEKELNMSGRVQALIIQGIPHYMIDIVSLNQEFTVAQFKQRAQKIISDIHKRKKIPFLVGGTMLYIQTLVDNFTIPRVPPDTKLRKKLESIITRKGLEHVYNQLITLDPGAKDFVQYQNPRRIIRALEVCIKTKKPFSQLRKKGKPLFNTLQIGIYTDREKLYKRINMRVDSMVDKGLIQEVKNLYQKYPHNRVLANTICYQEFSPYLSRGLHPRNDKGVKNDTSSVISQTPSVFPRGERDDKKGEREGELLKTIEEIKKNTRHYARRQTTWWKSDKRIHWIQNYTQAQKLVSTFLR